MQRVECTKYQVSRVAAARYILAKVRAHPKKLQLGGVLPHHNPGQAMGLALVSYDRFVLAELFVQDKSPCRFDTRMTLKEDYDLTCAHLEKYGVVVCCNHLMLFAKHDTNAGGACSTRDAQGQREQEKVDILMEKYPGAFIHNARAWPGYNALEVAKKQSQTVPRKKQERRRRGRYKSQIGRLGGRRMNRARVRL